MPYKMKFFLLTSISRLTKAVEGLGLGKIEVLYNFYSKVISNLRPEFVKVNGYVIYLDRKDSLLLSVYPTFEPEATKFVIKTIKKGMTVVDIGAHIGYFTLLFAKLVGPKGRVYAFEPSIESFKLLKKNVEANNFKNVTLFNSAVSNENKFSKLYLSKINSQDNRIMKVQDEERETKKVKLVSLDKMFKKSKINFIKIDVQGVEPLVFDGAGETIERNNNIKILFEYWPYMFKKVTGGDNFILKLSSIGKVRLLGKNGVLKTFSKNSKSENDINFVKQLYFEKD